MRYIETETQWVGLSDVATVFDVRNTNVSNWIRRDPTFPKPRFYISGVPVWYVREVVKWGVKTGRLPFGGVTIIMQIEVVR